MGFTIVAITAALIAALMPVLFMPDVVGRYFREFGVTLAVADRGLGDRVADPDADAVQPPARAWAAGATARASDRVAVARLCCAAWTGRCGIPRSIVATLLIVAGASAGLYVLLPKGFMPTQDTGILHVRTITIANISFAAMEQLQRTVADDPARPARWPASPPISARTTATALSVGLMQVNLKPLGPARRRSAR